MTQPPERLFRDDAGAALERAHRLEQENQALRAEIEAFKAGRVRPVPPPYRIGAVALCIASISVGATLTFSSTAELSDDPPPVVYAPPTAPPTYEPAPPLPTVARVSPPADCSTPYWTDDSGHKHYRLECLR